MAGRVLPDEMKGQELAMADGGFVHTPIPGAFEPEAGSQWPVAALLQLYPCRARVRAQLSIWPVESCAGMEFPSFVSSRPAHHNVGT